MIVNYWFFALFVFFWLLGPGTQVIQLISPKLHHRLGLTEKAALEPKNRWFQLYERGTAYADLTHLTAGIAFMVLALSGSKHGIVFGIYTCSAYVFVMTQFLAQLALLSNENLHPASKEQFVAYGAYAVSFIIFGIFGITYLWRIAEAL